MKKGIVKDFWLAIAANILAMVLAFISGNLIAVNVPWIPYGYRIILTSAVALCGIICWLVFFNLYFQTHSKNAELQQHSKKMRETVASADYANEAKTTFLAKILHDLRTPLTAISGYADLLESDHDPRIAAIKRSADYMVDLMNDISDLSTLESNRETIHNDQIHIATLVADVKSVVGPSARKKGLEFDVECQASSPEFIKSDPAKLKRALVNLLTNAVRYTEAGSVRFSVLGLEDDRIRFVVEDTGVGIPNEMIGEIRKPFFQVPSSSKASGSGLGLAITDQLLRTLDSWLEVSSEVGKGSRFSFAIRNTPGSSNDPIRLS